MADFFNTYMGQIWSLLTAVSWAVAVILFKKSGEVTHPIGLNLFKNLLAALLFVPTLYLFGSSLFIPVSAEDLLLVLLSGALGIGIGDTLFFKCLNALGAGLSAIVDCLYSPFTIGLSILFLGEILTVRQVVGVVLIISAVLTATTERKSDPADRRRIFAGVAYGVLAMAAMAVGIVIMKPLLGRLPLIWVTEVRLLGGVIVLLLVLLFHPSRRAIIRSVRSSRRWGYTLSGSFIGAYVAMLLWLAGMKLTLVSIAAALNQTSNIFIFIFAAVILHEKITVPRIIGIALGVGGALLVTFG